MLEWLKWIFLISHKNRLNWKWQRGSLWMWLVKLTDHLLDSNGFFYQNCTVQPLKFHINQSEYMLKLQCKIMNRGASIGGDFSLVHDPKFGFRIDSDSDSELMRFKDICKESICHSLLNSDVLDFWINHSFFWSFVLEFPSIQIRKIVEIFAQIPKKSNPAYDHDGVASCWSLIESSDFFWDGSDIRMSLEFRKTLGIFRMERV